MPVGASAEPFRVEAIRALRADDVEAAARLLSRLSACFAGVVSGSMCRAMCAEAARREDPVIVVAERDGTVAGIVVAVLHGARFWRRFFMRHPALALRLALARSRSNHVPGAGAAEGSPSGLSALPAGGPSWSDADEGIAKVLFVGVAPEHRRAGMAERLYAALFEQLRARGARRADGRIDPRNRGSLRLHEATGWTLYADGGVVLAVRRLP